MNHGFSSSTALSQAWKLLKNNVKFLASAVLVSAVIIGVLQYLMVATEDRALVSFVVTIVSIVAGLAISIGWIHVVFKLIRGNSQKWDDFKTSPKIWGKVFVNQLLIGIPITIAVAIIAVLAFILKSPIVIILGIILALVILVYIQIRFMFLSYVAIDNQGLGIIALLKKSFKTTKGYTLDLVGFAILMFLVNIGGLLLLGVGLLVTIPLTMIAQVFVYEAIHKKHADSDQVAVQ